jgi:ABC-type Zn uptake system ZnuABC Zn-binding protein ZnuA
VLFILSPFPYDPRMKAALTLLLTALAIGCGPSQRAADTGPLRVAATTAIVGDVVRVVGGPAIRLTVLLPPGQDPHAFNPAPAELAALTRARVLFANGLGLEPFLPRLPKGPHIVELSENLPARGLNAAHPDDGHEGHAAGDRDPHVWFNPLHVAAWTDTIRDSLSTYDPARAADYTARAAAYKDKLLALDAWILEQTARLPPERRRLVADHAVLGYFADRYGFTLPGVLVPSFSTAAEPSARDLAALEDAIRAQGIRAIFITRTVSPALAERVANDTGVKLEFFYDGTLSPAGGPASTYLDFMRHNVTVFINALKE